MAKQVYMRDNQEQESGSEAMDAQTVLTIKSGDVEVSFSKLELENSILKRIDADYQYARDNRSALDTTVQDWRRMFNGRFKEETVKKFGKGLIYIRKAASKVYRLLSGFLAMYYERRYLARLGAPHAGAHAIIAADIGTKTLRYHLRKSIKSYLIIEDCLMDAFVDGTCSLKMWWDPWKNAPKAEVLKWEDVFRDPDATCQEDIRFVIHEKEVDIDYLREMEAKGVYQNVDKVENYSAEDESERWESADFKSPDNKQRQTVYIREYWGKLQLLPDWVVEKLDTNGVTEATLSRDVVVTVYGDKVILRPPQINPYGRIPFIFGRVLKDKRELDKKVDGQSMMELLKDTEREHNSIRNQRRRKSKQDLQGRIIVGRTSGLDLRAWKKSAEGGIIWADDPRMAVPVPSVADYRSADMELGYNESEAQEISGVNEISMGQQPRSKQTATAVSMLTQMAMSRMGYMLQVFNLTLVEPMIQFLVEMIAKFETQENITRIIGADVMVPPLEAIFGQDLDVIVEAGIDTMPTQQQIQDVQMALQVITPGISIVPQVAVPAWLTLAKKLLELLPLEEVEKVWDTGLAQMAQPSAPAPGGPPGISGRGTESAAGQPPARPSAPRPVMPGQVQGGMSNAPTPR